MDYVVARQDLPPTPGPKDEILRLRADEQVVLHTFSDKLEGLWTHWDAARKRSLRCTKLKDEEGNVIEGCSACDLMLPRRWKGYLYSFDTRTKKRVFFEMQPGSATSMHMQIGSWVGWRGIVFLAKRQKGDKARIICTVQRKIDPMPADAPQHRSVIPTLFALWGIAQPEIEMPTIVDENPQY